MGQQYYFGNYCKRCFIKLCRPSKADIKRIVMTEYTDKCDKCGRVSQLVDYIEDGD